MINPDYLPLRLGIDPNQKTWTGLELRVFARALAAWS